LIAFKAIAIELVRKVSIKCSVFKVLIYKHKKSIMKCVVGLVFFAVCAMEMISAVPVPARNGMVFYQSQPDYYYGSNAHRAFVMQYASQPLKAYRRNGQAAGAGVSAFASGKKIAAGTYLRSKLLNVLHLKCANSIPKIDAEQLEDEEQGLNEPLDGGVQSVATAFDPQADAEADIEQNEEEPQNYPIRPVASDEPVEDEPTRVVPVPNDNRKTPIAHDEEDDEDDVPTRSRNRGAQGNTFFPVTFGSTNGGAIAIANSYSTGKGN
jgi:hypothetical protein